MIFSLTIGRSFINFENQDRGAEECPVENYDICDSKYTANPSRSYRVSTEYMTCPLREFWYSYIRPIFWDEQALCEQKHLAETCKRDMTLFQDNPIPLKPYIEKIRKLPDECGNIYDNDRMKWFKFWAEKAVELYGEEAVIHVS